MALTLSAPAVTQLPPKTWKAKILAYLNAKRIKKEADAASRIQDQIIKQLKYELREAMQGAPVAQCGNALLSEKTTAGSPAALTLTDGSSIMFADVTSILVGNRTIERSQIAKIFGGREGSVDVTVAGNP